jgi:hypothetical protein
VRQISGFTARGPADLVKTSSMTELSSFGPDSAGSPGSQPSKRRRSAGDDAAYWDSQAATFDDHADHGLRDPQVREAPPLSDATAVTNDARKFVRSPGRVTQVLSCEPIVRPRAAA